MSGQGDAADSATPRGGGEGDAAAPVHPLLAPPSPIIPVATVSSSSSASSSSSLSSMHSGDASTTTPRGILKRGTRSRRCERRRAAFAESAAGDEDSTATTSTTSTTFAFSSSSSSTDSVSVSISGVGVGSGSACEAESAKDGGGIVEEDAVHHKVQKPTVVWNEENLRMCEEQKDSHDKITEPKTPYNFYYDPSEDFGEDLEDFSLDQHHSDLTKALEGVQQHIDIQEHSASPVRWSSSSEDDESEERSAKRRRFYEQRRLHYDEYQKVMKFKSEGHLEEETEDQEEEQENEEDVYNTNDNETITTESDPASTDTTLPKTTSDE
ncbi:hypothetical protein Pelo_14862 [Pelomyxa schiedti]|nr:hypothetical protein Pelo_14862 [Pelomyxa schiedti]